MSSDVQLSPADPAASTRTPARSGRRALRWLVPAGGVAVVAVVAASVLTANANEGLPVRTPAQILADLARPNTGGFSGTVVEKGSFGLPDLSALTGSASSASTGLGLLSGSHTIRVWYGNDRQQRVALLDSLGETDLIRNGASLWEWSSQKRTAVHRTLPAGLNDPSPLPTTSPDQAAQRVLAFITPTTDVTTDRNVQVAGRTAYELVLKPKDRASRIGQVRIAVDGKTSVPLGVQVYPRDSARAAFDIAFTRFDDSMPSQDNFTWTPPAGVKVSQAGPQTPSGFGAGRQASTVGSGWTTVATFSGLPTSKELAAKSPQLAELIQFLPAVKGTWGSGHLVDARLVTILLTDDGRLFAGAVDPSVLYQAAAK